MVVRLNMPVVWTVRVVDVVWTGTSCSRAVVVSDKNLDPSYPSSSTNKPSPSQQKIVPTIPTYYPKRDSWIADLNQ